MNETKGNARTKPMKNGGIKGGEKNSLKDSEKTNELKIKGCLLHKSDIYRTPTNIYNFYIKKLKYFDPCPIDPKFDGLKIKWKNRNFVNPPYSQISKWIDKALYEKEINNNISVLLIPARTDTKWFRKLIENHTKIIFIQGRLHFNNSGPAPFPSMLVGIAPGQINNSLHFEYLPKENIDKFFK